MLPYDTEPRIRRILKRGGRLEARKIGARMGMTSKAVADACRRMEDVEELKIRGVRAPLFFMREENNADR